jgi:putative membrane protein
MKRSLLAISVTAALAALTAGTIGAQAKTAAGVSGLDEEYLKSSIQGDRFEISGGRMALGASQNPQVRALATTLVKDHTKSLADAVKLAKKLGVSVPKAPTPPEQWELRIAGTETGPAFDKWYSDLEVQDHKQDISEASAEASTGTNAAVRAGARKELPTLRRHLKLSQGALKAS